MVRLLLVKFTVDEQPVTLVAPTPPRPAENRQSGRLVDKVRVGFATQPAPDPVLLAVHAAVTPSSVGSPSLAMSNPVGLHAASVDSCGVCCVALHELLTNASEY